MPKTSLFLFSFSFILGLSLAVVIDLSLAYIYIVILLFLFFLNLKEAKRKNYIFLFLVFIFAYFYWPSFKEIPNNLDLGKSEFSAWVCAEPKVSWQKQSIVLCPFEKTSSGKIISWWPLYPPINYGDKLTISCFLSLPQKIDNFNYPQFLAKDDIYRH